MTIHGTVSHMPYANAMALQLLWTKRKKAKAGSLFYNRESDHQDANNRERKQADAQIGVEGTYFAEEGGNNSIDHCIVAGIAQSQKNDCEVE